MHLFIAAIWGRGTLKIINACREAGLPEPEFTEMNGGFSMTVFAHGLRSIAGKYNREKTSEKTSEKILNAILLNPHITIAELSELTGVTTRSIERNIETLRKSGKIKRIGPDKGGYWEVTVD